MKSYGRIVKFIEALPDEEQEMIVNLVEKRLAQRHREALVNSVREARKEFNSGKLRPALTDSIMRRILK